MNTSTLYPEAFEPEAAKEALIGLIEQACVSRGEPGEAQLLRVETPVVSAPPMVWLQAQKTMPRVYWSARDEDFDVAGVGAAVIVQGAGNGGPDCCADLERHLERAHGNARFFGGLRFTGDGVHSADWEAFGEYYFVLPRFEVFRQNGQQYLACNLLVPAEGMDCHEIVDEAGALLFPENALAPAPFSSRRRLDVPDATGWQTMVDAGLELLNQHTLQKIVLARETHFEIQAPIDPLQLLGDLTDNTERSYGFCIQPESGCAFIGASPERLYRRRQRHIETEAIAGTRPRGSDVEIDQALGDALLRSEKDRREHAFVVEAIRETLDLLCHAVHGDEDVTLLKLRNCQHLCYRLEGLLTGNRSDADILRRLHPTPAVGGVPTVAAVERINALEPFDRGWYAGPVGWLGRDGAEFAVAIRSALVREQRVRAYTGAGIVSGSAAPREWEELENKMSTLQSILAIND